MGVFEILLGAGIIFYSLYYYLTSNFDFWEKRNVPGPTPVPFFGNLKNYLLKRKFIGEILKEFYDVYKNESMFGLFLQKTPILIVKDPEFIKDVLVKDFTTFADRGQKVIEEINPLSADLFNLEPDRWRPLRSKLSPVFTSGKLKEMFYLMIECSEHFEKYVDKMADKPIDVDVRELSAKFTTDSIGVCAFGLEMHSIEDEDSEFRKMGRKIFDSSFISFLKRTLPNLSTLLYKIIAPFVFNDGIDKFFIGLMKDTMDYRTKNNINRHDFVNLLMDIKKNPEKIKSIGKFKLNMFCFDIKLEFLHFLTFSEFTDSFLTAQAFVFFAAGFETSSTTISNALLELALHPDMQNKLRNEIKEEIERNDGKLTYECVKNMKYLDKVFKGKY